MLTVREIAWLAGLLEGEGSFHIKDGCAHLQMQSTDKDVIRRATEVLSTKFHDSPCKPRGKDTYKPVWRLAVHGTRAISWMMTLYSLMGERRQTKIREVLDQWKASKAMPRAPRGRRFMAICHPDRPRQGNGLCNACWMREYRKRTGKNGTYYRHRAAAEAAANLKQESFL